MKSSERSFARRIDLTSLQLFVAVCELGSIGRAAEREFIAASAVSKRLSDLEAAVGTALLYRGTGQRILLCTFSFHLFFPDGQSQFHCPQDALQNKTECVQV